MAIKTKSARRLGSVFDRVGVILSAVLVLALSAIYVLAAYFGEPNKTSPDTSTFSLAETLWHYLKDVVAATVPVFILFITSYVLLKEINELKKDEESEELAEKIADKLSIKNPTNISADKFFTKKTAEGPLLDEAASEILFVQETGSLLFEQWNETIRKLLRKGGRLRGIVVTPLGTGPKLLAFRNANLSAQALTSRMEQFGEHVSGVIRESHKLGENIEIRFCPYPICSTMVLVDPDEPGGSSSALVRLAGFRNLFEDKLDFVIKRRNDPSTFKHYVDEFQSLWLASSKVILITGQPHSGKTSLLRRVLDRVPRTAFSFWALSAEVIGSPSSPGGYGVQTSDHQDIRVFATRLEDRKSYRIEEAIWTTIGEKIAASTREGSVFFIDELGWMQFRSSKFREVIRTIIDNPTISLFASISLDNSTDPLLAELKQHHRTTLIQFSDEKNENEIENNLVREINGLVKPAAF